MPYTKTNSGDKTQFDTVPEKAPIVFFYALPLMIIPLIILYLVTESAKHDRYLQQKSHTPWFWIIAGVIAVWLFFMQMNPKVTRYRVSSKFNVSPGGVQINERFYPAQDIQRLIVRNNIPSGEFYFNGPPPPNVIAGINFRKALVKVSWRVDMESNGVVKTLAGGLTNAAAFGILSDASKILGMNVS